MVLPRSYQEGEEGGGGVRAPHSASADPEGVRVQPLPCPTHIALVGPGVPRDGTVRGSVTTRWW